jgi:hypothetical protein
MADATDLLQEVGIATATTLDAPGYTIGDTSITLASTSGMPTATGITVAIDVVDSNGVQVPGSYNEYVGVVTSATAITSLSHANGTNRNYSAGATTRVYLPVSAERENRIVEWGIKEHNQDGTHSNITVSGTSAHTGVATFTTHIDVNDASTAIRDSSDNELLKFAKTAGAVNEVTLQNAATTEAPQIQATGGDSNVDLRLVPKGTGNVKRGATGGSIDWWEELGRTTLSGAGDTISLTGLPARKYLTIFVSVQGTGGTVSAALRFNNDSATNYAWRLSSNGGADGSGVSDTGALLTGASTYANFEFQGVVVNKASVEKLVQGSRRDPGTAGAANLPNRVEYLGKWANTADQITRVDVVNTAGAGDFAIGSEIIVLGHD